MNKQYAVFVNFVDAEQQIFDTLEKAEKEYNRLASESGGCEVFLCEVMKRSR